ncbi:MAG: nuclear transport factor 2 family protein [Acidimicrobiales bacterium]
MDDPADPDLAATVADLADLEAIRSLKARYARYCDDGYDPDGIASLFVDDGVWDGGELFGRCDGGDAIRRHFEGAPARIPWALHFTLVPELRLDGPPGPDRRAEGTWYLWQPCVRRGRDGTETEAWLAGTYRDVYVKAGGAWRFESVAVDARWLAGPPPSPPPGVG